MSFTQQQQKIHHQVAMGRGQSEGKIQPDARGKIKPAKQTSHLDTGEQLLEAVTQGKPNIVKRLLDTHANTNFANAAGETPLIKACSLAEGDTRGKIVALLLTKGSCNVNHQDSSRQTALMKAVQSRDRGLVKDLLSHKADVVLEDCEGNTALCHAAIVGSLDIIRAMLAEWKRHKLPIDCKNMRGLTPLLLAAQNGHLQGAKLLVEMGGASSTIRDLDNFMTAAEWLQQSSFCGADDINFLSPPHLQHSGKHKKRVKTLSDYLEDDSLTTASSPDMYAFKHKFDKDDLNLPVIKSHDQPHDQPPASRRQYSNAAKSMFDIPTLATAFSSTKSSAFSHGKPVPISRQAKLLDGIPQSRTLGTNCLAKRKSFLNPNRRGKFYAEGSLEPLQSGPNPKKLSRINSFCEDAEELDVMTNLRRSGTLPPLEPQ